jgi:hypothetical protein
MLPASIAPTAAPSAVATVQELFADSMTDVLLELLQAARATGAARVDVAVIGAAGEKLLQLSDDGHGLDEPGAIFAHPLPRFGIFSLAGRDVIVRSWSRAAHQGWSAHITAAAWTGRRPIAISPDPIGRGTAITFRMPAVAEAVVRAALAEAACLAGVIVTFNGRGI